VPLLKAHIIQPKALCAPHLTRFDRFLVMSVKVVEGFAYLVNRSKVFESESFTSAFDTFGGAVTQQNVE